MSRTADRWRADCRWAWRNMRARGWRVGLAAGLLAVALAGNALMFSVADSVVFHRTPYAGAGRLVEIQRRDPQTGRPGDSAMPPALFEQWRRQSDLFAGVQGFLRKNLFLSGGAEPAIVATADVTAGLIELLGARPRWGRSFVDGDDRRLDVQPVLVAESLARTRFGDPAAAVGQQLATTAEPLVIVGVMPADFRFPDGMTRIWRALDLNGPLTRNFAGVSSIARVAPGVPLEVVSRVMLQRSAAIGSAAGLSDPYSAQPAPLRESLSGTEQRRMFLILLGAAACLLLIACANVASLELANAVQRAHTGAIQLALGASRSGLARIAILEGAMLIAVSTAGAIALVQLGAGALVPYLPPNLAAGSANPIDLDGRTLGFMAAAALIVWAAVSLPVVFFAVKGNLIGLLKLEGQAVTTARGGSIRRMLTVAEVALAVMLLVTSVVYVRSYLRLLALDTGFDTAGVVTFELSIPPQAYPSSYEKRALARDAVERLRTRPGVIAAAAVAPPPSMGAMYGVRQLAIDDRLPLDEPISIAEQDVEPEYFSVLRIPLRDGRFFETGEPATNVIVSESFAKQFWPNASAVGHSYRRGPRGRWYTVVGVVGHVRTSYDPPGGHSSSAFQTYIPRQPPTPPQPAAARAGGGNVGGYFGFLTLMARVDSRARAADLYQTVRAIDSRFILKLDFVDDVYARQFDDRLLATRVIGAFGLLAFGISAAGIFGVMTFLVVHRRREIGIRMALGADQRQINRLVLGSALRLVTLGAALGILGTVVAARWTQSQLFGVQAADPGTIILVTLGVVATALLATWQPARLAARVDPKVLLRN